MADNIRGLADFTPDYDSYLGAEGASADGGRSTPGMVLAAPFKTPNEITISSGVATITRGAHTIQPESGTSDTLVTINGATYNGQRLLLRIADSADTVTIDHGAGNIYTASGADNAMTQKGTFEFIWDSSLSRWNLINTYQITASDVVSGTFDDARIAASNVTQHQGSINIAASQVTSGTFADARISESSVTQHQAALGIQADPTAGMEGISVTYLGGWRIGLDIGNMTSGTIAAADFIPFQDADAGVNKYTTFSSFEGQLTLNNQQGTLQHEKGGLEADVSAYSGLVAISGGATSEINTKAGLEGKLTDVNDLALADGDDYTGDHNFGGADTLEIPNGSAPPTQGTAGRIFLHDDLKSLHYDRGRFHHAVPSRRSTFKPTDISGCKAWYDGADSDTFFTDVAKTTKSDIGDLCRAWEDKSGSGYDMTQSGNAPDYMGLGCYFDRSNSEFLSNSTTYNVGTAFLVTAHIDASTFSGYHGFFTGPSGATHMFIGNSGTNNFHNGSFSANINVNGNSGTDWGSHNLQYPRVASGHEPSSPQSMAGTQIGKERNYSDRYLDGPVFEIITYDTILSDANIEKVEGYLFHKWEPLIGNILENVLYSHKYRWQAP